MTKGVRAFSLVELLVVTAIIVVLMAMAVPALNTVLAGSNVARAGQMVDDAFVLARQEAISKNRDVYVRFYKFPDGVDQTDRWQGVQIWSKEATAGDKPLGKFYRFPEGTFLTPGTALSPLLEAATDTGSASLSKYGSARYAGFRFRATGQIDGSLADFNWVTVQGATDTSTPPQNYYTLQINPITGKVLTYRRSL